MSCKLRESFILLDGLKDEEIGVTQTIDGKNETDKQEGCKKQGFGKDISNVKKFDIPDCSQQQEDKFICTRSRTKYLRKNFIRKDCDISSDEYSTDEEFLSIRGMKPTKKRNHDDDSDWHPKWTKFSELPGEPMKMKTRSATKNISYNSKANIDVMPSNLIKKLSNENKSNVSAVCSVEAKTSKHPHNCSSTSKSGSYLLLSMEAEDMEISSQLEQLSPSKTPKNISTQRKKDSNEEKRKNTGVNYSFDETKSDPNCISISKLSSTLLTTNDAIGVKDTKNSTQLMQQSFSKTCKPYARRINETAFNGAIIELVLQNKSTNDEDEIKESFIRKSQSLLSNGLEKKSVQVEYEKSNPKGKDFNDIDKTISTMTSPAVFVTMPILEKQEDLRNIEKTNSFSIPKLSPINHELKSIKGNEGLNRKETFKFISASKILSLTNSIKTIPVEKINKIFMLKEKAEGSQTISQNLVRNNKTTGFLRMRKEGLKLVKTKQFPTVSTVQRSPIVKKIQKFTKIVPNVTPESYFQVKFRLKKFHCPICKTDFLNRKSKKICKNSKMSTNPHRKRYKWGKTIKPRMGRKRKNHIEFSHDLARAKQQILKQKKISSESQIEMVISESRDENSKNIPPKTKSESNKNILHCTLTNTTLINIEEEESKSITNVNKLAEDLFNYSFLKPSYHEFENNTISSAVRELDALTLLAITDNEKDPRSGISFRTIVTKNFLKTLNQETSVTPELSESIDSCKNNLEVLTLAKKYLCLFGSFEKASDYFLRKKEKASVDEITSK